MPSHYSRIAFAYILVLFRYKYDNTGCNILGYVIVVLYTFN